MTETVYSIIKHRDSCVKCGYRISYSDRGGEATNIVGYCNGSRWFGLCKGIKVKHIHCECQVCGACYLIDCLN